MGGGGGGMTMIPLTIEGKGTLTTTILSDIMNDRSIDILGGNSKSDS